MEESAEVFSFKDAYQSCKMSIFYTEQKFKANFTPRKTRKSQEIWGWNFIKFA